MKSFSQCAAFSLALLSALLATLVSRATSDPPTPRVAGTVWAGKESNGDFCEYHFQPDGALHYRSPTGFWKNGTWKQDGTKIYMETNKRYSESEGVILGRRMSGRGWNVVGTNWTWEVERQ